MGDSFRLATFNLRHAAPPGHFARIGRAAKACVNLRADVLALQEVDAAAVRSFFVNQPAWIAAAVGAEWCFLPNWTHRALGRFGNALLVRGRLLDPVVVELPGSGAARARKALLAEVVLAGGTRLTVAATHLDERRRSAGGMPAIRQLEAVLSVLAGCQPPLVLMGDLNLESDSVVPLLRDTGFQWVDAGATFPADHPKRSIDWIAADGLSLGDAEIPAVGVSDHRPLVVTARRC